MVLKGVGRLFKRGDGKWLLYIPKDLGDDSQFPFSKDSQKVAITVDKEKKTLLVEPTEE